MRASAGVPAMLPVNRTVRPLRVRARFVLTLIGALTIVCSVATDHPPGLALASLISRDGPAGSLVAISPFASVVSVRSAAK